MLKISIKYAAICSVFLVVIFHLSAYLGIDPLINLVHLIFDLMMFGLFILFADKEYKAQQEHNIFHFWHGMTIGFNIYLAATILFITYLAVYFAIDETAVTVYQDAANAFIQDKKQFYIDEMGEEAFQEQLQKIKETTSTDLLISSGLKKIIAGFFITPVISIILRKQPK
ncbi:MAG: DUF4199 domain-containing protein [Cyclobacteriaceae bacterium]